MNDNIPRPEEDPSSEVRATARPRVEPMADDVSRRGFEDPAATSPEPGPGSHDPTRFDHNADVPSRESESPLPVPLLATGMFIPVVILVIVAIVLIFWFVF